MSAVHEEVPDPLLVRSETGQALESDIRALPSVDLATLEDAASLLRRVDRKYVVPVETFGRLVRGLDDGWRALEIDRCRLFGYTSTYFDTPDLATYRAHLQRRRRRFKVRVRRYAESGEAMLEVKRKGLRGMTVKRRTPHPAWRTDELGAEGLAFVSDAVSGYAELPQARLAPVVDITNRRATLVHLGSAARVTIDVDLRCGRGETGVTLRPGYVLIETKIEGGDAPVDRKLRELGERPIDVSKFCVGVASLGLDIPSNPWRRTMRRYFEATAS